MTFNLLTLEPLTPDRVTLALSQCLHVRLRDVDVADEATDQDLRNWDALVLCETATVLGDVSTSLDIYVQKSVRSQPNERELAAALARVIHSAVLFPAEEALPSAYWLATEDGVITRTRLNSSDDEEPRYTIDVVETPVAQLPHVSVERITEVVPEQQVTTPVSAAIAAHVQRMFPEESKSPGTPHWCASNRLGAWEKLIRQMEAGWAPSGWYPSDLYLERLEARDELVQASDRLPEAVTALLGNALAPLDTLFTQMTVEDTDQLCRELARARGIVPGHGWWWDRRPDPLPW
ncbi:hypothetical protein ABZ478_05070 [Streptomyces sp. NPDC005706]|uniref:hypothetical protein n=1 Tax=Streptomyces sp. NPDC005706 TaxID=3157169 RepID=UPI0033D4CB27